MAQLQFHGAQRRKELWFYHLLRQYVSASYSCCQALWIKILLEDSKVNEVVKIKLLFNNKSTIYQANHPMVHKISKHIERKYHFLRDQVGKERLKINYCKIELLLASIQIKPLKKVRSGGLKGLMGIRRQTNIK